MKVDIKKYWPTNLDGSLKSVNSVFLRFENTDQELHRATLSKALWGESRHMHITTLCKLRDICRIFTGDKSIQIEDLFAKGEK